MWFQLLRTEELKLVGGPMHVLIGAHNQYGQNAPYGRRTALQAARCRQRYV